MNFERGLSNLDGVLTQAGLISDSDEYLSFVGWKRQLIASVESERRYAVLSPQEQERRERILMELDRLTLRYTGKSFLDICAERPSKGFDRWGRKTSLEENDQQSPQRQPEIEICQVQLILEGEVTDFNQIRQQDLVNALAALLRTENDKIRILQVHSGSIYITLEMPESAANRLHAMAANRDHRLASLKIISMKIIGVTVSDYAPHVPSLAFKASGHELQLSGAFALIIGVGDYTNPRFANLPATVRDAQAIATVLTDASRCGYHSNNVQIIVGQDATAANIRNALKTLTRSTNDQSTVFVFFSGHGGRAFENGGWQAYLCPRDANPDDLAHTAVSGKEFSDLLASILSQKLLVMLDACHSAGSADLKATDGTVMWKAGLPDEYYEALSHGGGRVVIASSKPEQYSYVRKQGDLSVFTWHLHEALTGKAAVRGDGLIHVLDVFHHVNEAVQAEEPMQTPILKVKDMDLNFPIALDKGGKGVSAAPIAAAIAEMREQIVRDPLRGARALSDHLATLSGWASKRTEVDLKRTELERIQYELELFGPNPTDQAAKNRVVYYLLRMCLELEQAGR